MNNWLIEIERWWIIYMWPLICIFCTSFLVTLWKTRNLKKAKRKLKQRTERLDTLYGVMARMASKFSLSCVLITKNHFLKDPLKNPDWSGGFGHIIEEYTSYGSRKAKNTDYELSKSAIECIMSAYRSKDFTSKRPINSISLDQEVEKGVRYIDSNAIFHITIYLGKVKNLHIAWTCFIVGNPTSVITEKAEHQMNTFYIPEIIEFVKLETSNDFERISPINNERNSD